ncbi:xaa-Pro aminopeptidase 3 [Teleopsis dalmanni]|uniref:xaa-Pro aminopeptidase 3 n=1 Tax=Teleopsis dalmanni TaxID=139649 RepID=UPI0018CFA9E0|nr:xaa-Pro aminopeptidase 3 [Teleopsis dalmanni]
MLILRKLRLKYILELRKAVSLKTHAIRCLSSTKLTPETQVATPLIINETYGQPTSTTHPHLINEGQLVPGVCVEEFRERRSRLMGGLQKFAKENPTNENEPSKNHLVIIPSACKKFMSDKIPYVFRQNSDFYYLSGCLEPDTVLMISINEQALVKSTLFMRPKDKHAELWDGPRTGINNALDMFGVEEAYPSNEFKKILSSRLKDEKPVLWYDAARADLVQITKDVNDLTENTIPVKTPVEFIQSMRLFKSIAEQALMRQTCQIASEAINEVIREARPGHSEHHIFAMVDYKCRMRNANYLAYPPVVASGNNATTIHYINNTQLTKSGDLVLLDAGCEYGGYTSDITRTWPINGTFRDEQKVLYEVLQQIQKELIATIQNEGGETLDNLFELMCIKMGKYMQEIGLIPKYISTSDELAKEGYKFCPHHVSHYLGMDVHDTPLMPRTLRILPGMVFTIEPGIYIAHDRIDVPKEFRGIGLRIEDDVLITANKSVEVLTSSCIKDRSDIELLFKAKS